MKRLVGAKGKGAAAPGPRRVHRLSVPGRASGRAARGEAVRDLQRPPRRARVTRSRRSRLGTFGDATEAAVRGLPGRPRASGSTASAARETWAAVVESGYAPRRPPALRPPADAARRRRRRAPAAPERARASTPAGRTGSSAPTPTGALIEFQRNAGLAADGICGRDTHRGRSTGVGALGRRLGGDACASARRCAAAPPARRAAACSWPPAPGFEALADAVVRGSHERGRRRRPRRHAAPTSPALAAAANRYAADLFLALSAPRRRRPGAACSYFESGRFRSEAGLRGRDRGRPTSCRPMPRARRRRRCGRAYAVLRETRMAAVVCEPVAEGDVAGMHGARRARRRRRRRRRPRRSAAASSSRRRPTGRR